MCPHCGSEWVMPTVVKPGVWECWTCEETWTVEP